MLVRGERIRKFREERGYSLAEFASKANVSISYLSEIERGAKKPSLRTLDRIAQTLNVSRAQLVELDGDIKGISLGDKVRLLREEKNWTLNQLAEKAGISISYLSEIERGNVYPAVHTVRRLAEELGVSPSVLVGQGGALGHKIRKAREEQGLTQAELARLAGVSGGLIGQIEHGKVQPSLQTVEKIAGVLGMSPCYFIVEDVGLEDMVQVMGPGMREVLSDPKVQSVLRLICNCSSEEIKFILNFIQLYKRSHPGFSSPEVESGDIE
ncbi:MAG: transcriptional regulator [Clostridia bacterium]|nr:transcriptional regulator [Clostridia bacterium]